MSNRKRWLRSPAVLLIAFVTILGLSGLVFAHWTTTLTIEGQVNTGNLGMGWQDAWTDDDGWVNDWDTGDDGGGSEYDYWRSQSSGDPAGPSADAQSERRTKDVGRCNADGEGDRLYVNLDNTYPSYWCTVSATAMNEGSIPVRATAFDLTAATGYWQCDYFYDEGFIQPVPGHQSGDENGEYQEVGGDPNKFDTEYDFRIEHDFGPYIDANGDRVFGDGDTRLYNSCNLVGEDIFVALGDVEGAFAMGTRWASGELVAEITGEIMAGIRCGTQVDPQEGYVLNGWLHVEQAATQGTTYNWTMTQQFVNWNEWDASMCTPGAVIVNPDGTPYVG